MIRGAIFYFSWRFYLLFKNENYFKPHVKTVIINKVSYSLYTFRDSGYTLFPLLIVLLFLTRTSLKIIILNFGFTAVQWREFILRFYYGLYKSYGSFIAFNMDRTKFVFKSRVFFLHSKYRTFVLFTELIRPHLNNQFISILILICGVIIGDFTFMIKIS